MGAALGALNGVLVWKVGIPSIVVTLGTMTIYRGIIFLMTDGKWVNAHEMSDAFKALPRHVILGLPVMSWVAIALIAIFAVVLIRTPLGRASMPLGATPMPLSMQGSTSAGRSSGPSCCPGRWRG